ncbi:MAG TPA: tyrosine--tRNA ligase [Acidimicrobiales bacterium]|nr:tyrosine--tRNA ligase [Acidimicrobiales bacterium]
MTSPPPRAAILDDLAARGLIHDSTDRAELAALLESGPVALYYGCDPTADSLHAGNLIGLLILRRFQLAGHTPIALAGGATGMIGDPSGRSDERNLLDAATLAHNVEKISEQLGRFIDFEGGDAPAEIVDNATWTAEVSLIDFLRDVGKHFTVNQMVAKESVRSRMDSDNGISFTEFSYMLLQANDFAWLHEHRGCLLQIGGSDQWGNITAGIDLIRRRFARPAHGLTWPLMTRADGTKFGKSAGENVWLGAHRTPPYRFYQYWMQSDDRDVEKFLLQLTMLTVDKVREIVATHAAAPERREAQRVLAREVTELVHGGAAVAAAEEATAIVFGGTDEPSEAALESLIDEIPTVRLTHGAFEAGVPVVDLLVEAAVVSSKGEARRLLGQGGATVGGVRPDGSATIGIGDLRFGRFLLVRKGKRQVHLVVAE